MQGYPVTDWDIGRLLWQIRPDSGRRVSAYKSRRLLWMNDMMRSLLLVLMICLAVFACAPTAFGQYVTYSVKAAPAPIYTEGLPVCAPDDLRKVSLPNTTIDSVTADRNLCKVTLTVTHPPAKDRVKVWVALPMKNWNGRLLGQGGMGFVGGLEFFTIIPAATGFVTVATD